MCFKDEMGTYIEVLIFLESATGSEFIKVIIAKTRQLKNLIVAFSPDGETPQFYNNSSLTLEPTLPSNWPPRL